MILLFFLLGFSAGEKLEYVANYGFLKIGTMTWEVKDTENFQDANCYQLASILSSNPSLNFLFSLHDTIEVYARSRDLLPILYREKKHEGKYHKNSVIFFNQESLYASYDDSSRFALPGASRDLLSFWYYVRTMPLIIGDTVTVNVHQSKCNYRVVCHVIKKERITTPCGSFNAILVEPRADVTGIFSGKDAMQIWYSDDAARYPVQIRTKMKYGSILFKLKGVRN